MSRAMRAWFWMLDYAYTITDELRAFVSRPDPRALLVPGPGVAPDVDRRPVLLLPGVFETWTVLRRAGAEAQRLGHPVHVLPGLGRTVATIDSVARQVAQYIDANDLHGVLLLAHSKGGLVGKYVMLRFDAANAIDGLIAINAPFSGSHWGRYLPVPSIRALTPTDLTVQFVGAPSEVNARIVSLYSSYDQNIHSGSRLPGARNVRLAVAGHSRILGSKGLSRLLPQAIGWLPPRTEPEPPAPEPR